MKNHWEAEKLAKGQVMKRAMEVMERHTLLHFPIHVLM